MKIIKGSNTKLELLCAPNRLKPFEKLVDIFISEEKSIEYLFTNNVIIKPELCEHCSHDESKSCKRKYHKGHQVKGTWIVGGISRKTKKKLNKNYNVCLVLNFNLEKVSPCDTCDIVRVIQ
ncbi:hypothetical protein BDB01DRAFT_839149 [Pilobolus umbonatus]|nr:hypothetical protein BDB01DRAFT_839149 [Pilobolus umbonatus]